MQFFSTARILIKINKVTFLHWYRLNFELLRCWWPSYKTEILLNSVLTIYIVHDFTLESTEKKFRGGTKAFEEALLIALFTENFYRINLQSFYYDQVNSLTPKTIEILLTPKTPFGTLLWAVISEIIKAIEYL